MTPEYEKFANSTTHIEDSMTHNMYEEQIRRRIMEEQSKRKNSNHSRIMHTALNCASDEKCIYIVREVNGRCHYGDLEFYDNKLHFLYDSKKLWAVSPFGEVEQIPSEIFRGVKDSASNILHRYLSKKYQEEKKEKYATAYGMGEKRLEEIYEELRKEKDDRRPIHKEIKNYRAAVSVKQEAPVLWWEKEREQRKEALDKTIALRNEVRSMLGF